MINNSYKSTFYFEGAALEVTFGGVSLGDFVEQMSLKATRDYSVSGETHRCNTWLITDQRENGGRFCCLSLRSVFP